MIIFINDQDYSNFSELALLKFLTKKTPISFVQLKKLFREKKIKINGKRAKENQTINLNDEIEILFYNNQSTNEEGKRISINQEKVDADILNKKMKNFSKEKVIMIKKSILFEDDNLIFFNKERGLAVQGGSGIGLSLDEILSFIYQDKIRIVHRIDKETKGLVVFAKNYKTATEMTNLFQDKKIVKIYYAVIDGVLEKEKGLIDRAIFYKDEDREKEAITRYEVVKKYNNISLVRLFPETGRKHQLRIHLSGVGCPIIGDEKYNRNIKNNLKDEFAKLPMQLYSFSITIPDFKTVSLDEESIFQEFEKICNLI